MITFKEAVEELGVTFGTLKAAKFDSEGVDLSLGMGDKGLPFIVENADAVFGIANPEADRVAVVFRFTDPTLKTFYPLADYVDIRLVSLSQKITNYLLKAIVERSAPPAPSLTDQRYDQIWSFIGEANKPDELTEFGQGIRAAFECMCEENTMEDVEKYWNEIKTKSYKKKKYSVEVERRIFYSLEVEATNETEAENLATEESAKLAAIKPDSGWYIDDSQDDEVRFCEEIK